MSRPAQALVNQKALRHNFQQVKHYAPNTKIMAVVKANAYGHGLDWVAASLYQADAYAVASVEEGIQLREVGLSQPVCLLTGFFDSAELLLVEGYQLTPAIHCYEQIKQLESYSCRRPMDVWIKVDTGMHRIGFDGSDLLQVYKRLEQCAAVRHIYVMSHLSCADDKNSPITQEQATRFIQLTKNLNAEKSLANSAGIIAWPGTRLQWVRPGIMLYGASPLANISAESLGLKPVMTLVSQLIAIHEFKKGDAVGYGASWVCPEDMRVGVVAVGYGDGYPRHAKENTPVLINNKRLPLIGRVSMDMITVDLRQQRSAKIGDRVELWGQNLPVDEVAAASDTLSYELFCHVTDRVQRVVVT